MKLGRSNQFDLLFISNIIQDKDEIDHAILSTLSNEDILEVAVLLLESKAVAHAILILEFAVLLLCSFSMKYKFEVCISRFLAAQKFLHYFF